MKISESLEDCSIKYQDIKRSTAERTHTPHTTPTPPPKKSTKNVPSSNSEEWLPEIQPGGHEDDYTDKFWELYAQGKSDRLGRI